MIHEHLLILNADCATAWKGEVLEGQERRGVGRSGKERTLPVRITRRIDPMAHRCLRQKACTSPR
jgi:hypothetical protein